MVRLCDTGAALAKVRYCGECPKARIVRKKEKTKAGKWVSVIDHIVCTISGKNVRLGYIHETCNLPVGGV